jgi:uncharacterized protein (DUF1697 family)
MNATYAALLRGVNVGGANRLPMARLREVAAGLGWEDVATYIQSGNLVFSAAGKAATLAEALHDGIRAAAGLDVDVVVLTRAEVVTLETDCPWSQDDPRHVHALVHPGTLGGEARAAVGQAVTAARQRGSLDEARAIGRVLYLRTPDGLGRSTLAPLLERSAVRSLTGRGTARNLATVRRLREMVDA